MENQKYGNAEFNERLDTICAKYADKTAFVYMRDDDSKTLFTFGEIHERMSKSILLKRVCVLMCVCMIKVTEIHTLISC